MIVSRFAPSPTGEAHPGTLLSALLVWLDVRSRGGRALLRLEDLDRTRVRAAWSDQMRDALAWLGLDWDEAIVQSDRTPAHEAALDQLARAGLLYPCTCSRADRAGGRPAPDGGWAYENTCRGRPLPAAGWRAAAGPLRVQLPDDRVELVDAGGLDLSQTPARDMGDPIVRRRDGVIAYQLAVVVDDADERVTDVVRGRDIAPSTATQVLLQRLLAVPTPRYRHHFLLLEPRQEIAASASHERTLGEANPSTGEPAHGKLAKLHGSIPFSDLRARHAAGELVAMLAAAAGQPALASPRELVSRFDWARVPAQDLVARFDAGRGLAISPA